MKFLIVANGPFLSKDLITPHISQADRVIALDGAADKLAALGIMPNIIIGDLDSIDKHYWKNNPVKMIQDLDQNSTDLEKGIKYADANGAKIITIICATGGRMEHSLGNIRFLRKYFNPNRSITIYTESQLLEYVRDREITVTGKIGDYCGIMAFPKAVMTTHGLKYDTHNYVLEYGYSESISNELSQNSATIKIQGEALIIYPTIYHPPTSATTDQNLD